MIYLKIRQVTSDRFIVEDWILHNPSKDIPTGDNIISLDNISNPDQWEFSRTYQKYDKGVLRKIGSNQYQFDIRINKIRQAKINLLKQFTRKYIYNRMPVEKQIRYFEFIRLHEKIRTSPEDYIYGVELNNRDAFTVIDKVSASIKWIYDCIAVHNNYIDTINAETDIKVIAGYNLKKVNYPKWIF